LIRDRGIDLLCKIQIPFQIKVELSLLGEMEVQVTGQGEDSSDNEDDEKSNLGLQSNLGDPLMDQGSDPLNRKGGDGS
jgi:hypothetical protein